MSAADLLRGAIDIHVHTHPDLRPRKLDDLQLVAEARAVGMRALLLKSHVFSTVERAYLAKRMYPDLCTFGGLVLNATVGGFNPEAVAAPLRLGAVQIWLPTLSAENHARHLGGGDALTVAQGPRLRPEVVAILGLVADHGSALGTGHLSPEELRLLIPQAIALGVRHVVVTHPEWRFTAVPLEWQGEWTRTGGVYFERCLVSTSSEVSGHVPMSTIVSQIRAVGVATTIISTDYGLETFLSPVAGMQQYIEPLLRAGFAEDEITAMVQHNPARLLGLVRLESAASADA